VVLITIPAINWPASIGFEGDLGLLSAISAGHFMHFTWFAVVIAAAAPSSIESVSSVHNQFFPFQFKTIMGLGQYTFIQLYNTMHDIYDMSIDIQQAR
jgi:hypothetical protein